MTNHSDLVVELRETLKWATGRDQRTILNAIDVLEGLTEQSTDGSNEPVSEDVDEVRTNIRMQAIQYAQRGFLDTLDGPNDLIDVA